VLKNLDKVDWSNLAHAYGTAEDVPGLLRSLASTDEEERSNAIYDLYGSIWHQGTVYAATVYAVPFLLELLESPKVEGKNEILVLLAHLARGTSYHDVHQHLPMMAEKAKEPEWQDKIQKELGWVNDVKAAVKTGENQYLAFLNDADARMRDTAAYALAALGPSANLAEAVWRRLEKENVEGVRESLLLAFGELAEHTEANVGSLLALLLGSSSKSLKLAAAMSLVRLSPSEQSEESIAILLEAAQSPEAYDTLTESIWAEVDDREFLVLNHISRLEGNAARAAESAMMNLLPTRPHPEAIRLAETLLTIAFRDSNRRDAFASLNEQQQRISKLIADSENIWTEKIGGSKSSSVKASMMLRSCGLPDQQGRLRAFIYGAPMPDGIEREQKLLGIGDKLRNFFGRRPR
jgi:hypothetical protein